MLSLPQAGVAVEWLSADDSLVSRARNTLVAKFLESRAEPLLLVPGRAFIIRRCGYRIRSVTDCRHAQFWPGVRRRRRAREGLFS